MPLPPHRNEQESDLTHPGSASLPDDILSRLEQALASRPLGWTPRTRHREGDKPVYTNRLALETSPYLQQHAHNPVNWRPWGPEAFEEARALGRPVFLSIGYATCHWCHVMEEESFEDLDIAEYLNAHFVPVKVDREERPDVDAIYMAAVQALTGRGGWPMSVWLTPDKEPFYAGTYFPPRDGERGVRMGFRTLLEKLHALWNEERERVLESAASLTKSVQEHLGAQAGSGERPTTRLSDDIVRIVERLHDPVHGGLSRAPKFPSSLPVRLLLRVHRRTGNAKALEMATRSLEAMAAGGLYDQLGGGFHRYSTDERWLVPHFEKMLYDNALLSLAYLEAHQVTGREDFARVVREVLGYVEREMTSPEGGFYSATDADSEGEEGRFFVWTPAEIRALLPQAEAERFIRHYGVSEEGNFEGRNILFVAQPSEEEWRALAQARRTLYAEREKRPKPLLDDKILAAWNGLMISAFAQAARVFGEKRLAVTAARAALFVLKNMREGDRLRRSYKDAQSRHDAFLDDYAFLCAGLIDLYEATGDVRWVREARALAEVLERHYADSERGGWFMSADDQEAFIVREKPSYDGAEPSGGSVATLCFLRLGALSGEAKYTEAGLRALEAYGRKALEEPMGQTELSLTVEFLAGPPKELVLAYPDGESGGALEEVARKIFAPHLVRIVGDDTMLRGAASELGPAEGRTSLNGKATAYLCEQGACQLPVYEVAALRRLLE